MSLDDDLQAATLTAALTTEQRAALISCGREVHFRPDDVIFAEGVRADQLWILLEGQVELSRRIANRTMVVATMSTAGQWAGGLAAWGDGDGVYRATGRGLSSGRFLAVPAESLGSLVEAWSPFAKHMINGVYQTIRSIDTAARERESLVALGTLAAGLAHEINNPASASMRAVEGLRDASAQFMTSFVGLAEHGLDTTHLLQLDRIRADLQRRPESDEGAIERADREELIGTWLEDRDVGAAWVVAPLLAARGVDELWLQQLQSTVTADAVSPAVRWIASAIEMSSLLSELGDTTARISHLVEDVKTYSAMDRATAGRTDVKAGLESTLRMLAAKLESIDVVRSYADDLPELDVYAAELNQVWTNLIDNAIDAMEGRGVLQIAIRRDATDLVVEITDDGPGIDESLLHRVFEPFFTTKDVGRGTGLGLDISRRIIDRHEGVIEFDSRPGATTARVRLPIAR